MNIENLIVLQYANNECYTTVVSVKKATSKHKSFSVDTTKNKWSYEGKEYKIGNSRYIEQHYGVIGVYDRMSIKHLDSMVHDAKEATSSRGYCLDY